MFAAVVFHDVTPGFLPEGRARLDAATRSWADYLAARPGFVEFSSLVKSDQRVVAVSIWRTETDFQAMLVDPDNNAVRAGFAGMFASLAPEFFDVSEYRRGEAAA